MIGRKAIVGLSLLCALCFCAFAASSASAAGTTVFECVEGEGKDFSDAHCDNQVAGKFGHKEIKPGVVTTISAVNDLTGTKKNAVLEGKLAGVFTKVECKTAAGTGTVTNNAGPPMSLTFGSATTEFTACEVIKPEKCTVTVAKTTSVQSDPMNLKLGAEKEGPAGEKLKVHEEAAGSTEMGLKFAPVAVGGNFTVLTFAGAECPAAVKGEKPVKGFAYCTGGRGGAATSSGATCHFTKASTLGGLTFGGQPATLEATFTFRSSSTNNPLTVTTTAT